jgi:hypothetical protein
MKEYIPLEIQLNILHTPIIPMHIPKSRRQKVNPRIYKRPRLLLSSQQALQIARILDAIFPPINPARLRFRRYAFRMEVFRDPRRLLEILFLFVVRHVDHDAVEGILGCLQDLVFGLRVV